MVIRSKKCIIAAQIVLEYAEKENRRLSYPVERLYWTQAFEQFFSKMAFQPTCLHDFAIQPRWLSRFLLFQAYTMPTRCLHKPTRF